MSKIEIGKQYVTRGGYKVRRILCVDRGNPKGPVVAELEDGAITTHTAEGMYYTDGTISSQDLIEVRPLHETLKRDDKVMVRFNGTTEWHQRHFSHYDGMYHTFYEGTTSWSSAQLTHKTAVWHQCRLPTPEELGAA